jgi:hypothetical protein
MAIYNDSLDEADNATTLDFTESASGFLERLHAELSRFEEYSFDGSISEEISLRTRRWRRAGRWRTLFYSHNTFEYAAGGNPS